MSLPAFDTPVMIRVPDREVLSGTVSYSGPGWLDVEPKHAPEDRKRHGLVLPMSVAQNTSLPDVANYTPRFWLNRNTEQ